MGPVGPRPAGLLVLMGPAWINVDTRATYFYANEKIHSMLIN